MQSWVQRTASLLVVLALVGTPSVVAACALLCLPDAGHHEGASAHGPAAEAATAHADCHGSQAAAPTVTTANPVPTPGTPASSRVDASIVHTCCPDAPGLPATASVHGRGSADPLTGAPASWIAPRDGEWLFTSRARTRHPSALPLPSFASAPLVLRI